MASSSYSFRLPLISENPSGWGPVGSQDSCLESDIPYAPFNKAGRLGKIADWNSQYSSRQQRPGRSGPSDLLNEAFYEEETEDTTDFHLVLGAKVPKKPGTGRFGSSFSGSRNTFRFRPRGGRPGSSLPGHADSAADSLRGKGLKHLHRPAKGRKQELARQRWATYTKGGGSLGGDREPSVSIQPSWVLKNELDFDNLRKCVVSARDVAVVPDDLARAGALYFLDNKYERPAVKKEETLVRRFVGLETLPIPSTTSEDPVMQRLASEGHGNVFITDELLSVIMTAERSVYPWDLVVTRKGDKLFIDKRNSFTLNLDTVNETATEPPRDHDLNNPAPAESTTEVNAPAPLALEATRIGANYQHMVLQQTVAPLEYVSSPLESEGAAKVSRAYRYRLWNIGSNIKVVVRSALDGVRSAKGDQMETLFIRALNEFDPRSDGMSWRQKLASQPGAIIATEMKNNSAKLARWLLQAHLSGADSVLMGYVSRTTYRTNTSHVILGNQLYKPHELISQLSLDVNHCWGVFVTIVSLLLRQPEGKYCLLRDSSLQLCIFQVPIDETFEKRAHQRVETEHDLISQALPSTPIASSSSSSR